MEKFMFYSFFFFFFLQESAGEDIPIMLLGNKIDKQLERQVQHETGQRLAKVCAVFPVCVKNIKKHIISDGPCFQESQMAFFECSAYSGCNVMESMVHLAR